MRASAARMPPPQRSLPEPGRIPQDSRHPGTLEADAMAGGKALVAGATGVVGRYLLMHLLERGGWEVVAVSRRKPDVAGDYRHIGADLTNAPDCRSKLSALHDVTHVFYAAYLDRPDVRQLVEVNTAMLANLVDA